AVPQPALDGEGDDLLNPEPRLSPAEEQRLAELEYQLELLLASEKACPGDGNGDGVVDQEDIDNHSRLASQWGGSSLYDFNHDGLTDAQDLAIIQANLGACPQYYRCTTAGAPSGAPALFSWQPACGPTLPGSGATPPLRATDAVCARPGRRPARNNHSALPGIADRHSCR